MWKRANPWIASFVIGVTSGIVSYLVLQNPWLAALVALATILSMITVLLYLRTEEIRQMLTNVTTAPQCCGLQIAGCTHIFQEASQSIGLDIEQVSRSYKFLGVSAQFILDTNDFEPLVKEKAAEKDCLFQILLLDPNAGEIVERHAREEGMDPNALKFRLHQSIAQLGSLALRCGGNLEVWLYRELPVFRLVLINDEVAYVSFYGGKGLKGVQTPQLVFSRTSQSFFIAFSKFYKELLSRSKRAV